MQEELGKVLDLVEWFPACCDSDRRRKPNPGMLLDGMARLIVRPDQCIMAGVDSRDVLAANNAGIKSMPR